MANPNTAIFPTALPNDSDLLVASNQAYAQLSAAMSDVQTDNMQVSAAYDVPAVFMVDSELILAETVVGSTYGTLTRGFAGTTPAGHNQGTDVYGFIEAWHHNQLSAEVQAICTALGINLANVVKTGATVGGDLSGTLPNPTVAAIGGVSSGNVAQMFIKQHTQGVVNRYAIADANYTAAVNDYIITFSAQTASRTITLPDPTTIATGKVYVIKDELGTAATNNIILDPYGAAQIDGASTKTINTNYAAVRVYNNGTHWFTM